MTSIVGVMYFEMYLPKAEFFSLSRSGPKDHRGGKGDQGSRYM